MANSSPYFEAHPYDIMAPWVPANGYSKQCHRPWHSLSHSVVPRVDSIRGSDITIDKEKLQVCLDVHNFSPEELSVKTVDRHVIVEAKHEEKEDEHGSVARHFVRKYLLPEGHKSEDVVSSLSAEGVLCITAPKMKAGVVELERIVPISVTASVHGVMKSSSEDRPSADNMQQQ